MESYKRTYVAVNADFRADGLILPRLISWYDDHKYQIDRVIRVEQAAARKAGSSGDRYTIMVRGKHTYLFFKGQSIYLDQTSVDGSLKNVSVPDAYLSQN